MWSRRNFLRFALFSTFALLCGSDSTTSAYGCKSDLEDLCKFVKNNNGTSILYIKVVYFQMAQLSGAESFILQSPAVLRDLLSVVISRHPSLAPMMASMWILINGTPSKPDSTLRDGDEVNFIPLVAGG